MSQLTLTGKKRPIQAPFNSLEPAELVVWNFLNSMCKGYTHNQLKQLLLGTGYTTFDNRLRGLYKKGWVKKWKGPDDIYLWYAVPKEARK